MKVDLGDLVAVIYEALKEDGWDCSLHKICEETDKKHQFIYVIKSQDGVSVIRFSKSEAVLGFDSKSYYETAQVKSAVDAFHKKYDEYQSAVYYQYKKNAAIADGLDEDSQTISKVTVHKLIRYDLDDCDVDEFIPSILLQHLYFVAATNELRQCLSKGTVCE